MLVSYSSDNNSIVVSPMHLNCEISKGSSAPDGLNYLTYYVRGKSQSMYLLLTSDTVGVVLWNVPLSTASIMQL